MGFGASQAAAAGRRYSEKKTTGNITQHIDDGFQIVYFREKLIHVVEMNADHWKSELHAGLSIDDDRPGAICFYFSTDPHEHTTYVKHVQNEKKILEVVPGRGVVTRWINEGRKPNHYLDTGALALCAGGLCGYRVDGPPAGPPPAAADDELPPDAAAYTIEPDYHAKF